MSQTELHSVVVPMFREAEGAEEFHRQLTAALSVLPSYEIVYVEDHSPDRTHEVLCALAASDPHVRVLRFSRRYGHQIALTAGIDFASGDTVTVMDGDLQHPPDLVPRFVDEWRRGADVVFAIKQSSTVESRRKRCAARAFYARMLRLALDGIFSFSTRPLKMATWVGIILAVVGLLYALVLTVLWAAG